MKFILKLSLIALISSLMLSTFASAKTVIHRGEGGEPASLDPHKVSGIWENAIVGDLFTGLLQYTADGGTIAGVASSWTISQDGTVYRFKLRKDALWSDGKPVTSEDFVYAYRRILNPKMAAKYANILYPIKNAEALNTGKLKGMEHLGVKAINPQTLQITLEAPTPYFLSQLKHYTAYPIPKHVVQKHEKDWAKPEHMVSNGPFVLSEWKPQTYVKAIKNPKFFAAKEVHVDEVYYYPTEDRSAALKRFRAGELDMNSDFPTEQFKWLKTNMPDETKTSPYMGIYYYPINSRKKVFQDKRVREALNLAINREVLVDKVLTTGEIAAYSFVPKLEGYKYAELKFKSMPMKDRIKKAKQLIEEVGYSKDKPLELEIRYNTSENHKKVAVAISAMWKQIGVKTKLFNSETAVHYNDIEEGKFDVARAGWIADYADAQNFLMLLEYPNKLNYGAWSNKEYNALMDKAAKTVDLKERAKIMQQAEQLALDDYAIIPIYYYVSKNLVSKKIKGWKTNAEDIHRTRWMSK